MTDKSGGNQQDSAAAEAVRPGRKIIAAISSSPNSLRVLRKADELSKTLGLPWAALYVERGASPLLHAREDVLKNVNYARSLGAEILSTTDEDIVTGIARIVEQVRAGHLVIGRSGPASPLDALRSGRIDERLLRTVSDCTLHIIPAAQHLKGAPFRSSRTSVALTGAAYAGAGLSVLAMTFINLFLVRFTGYWTIALIYLLFVALYALFTTRLGPVLFVAAASALLWNYLFIPPLHTFSIGKFEDVLMYGLYFIIALIVGTLSTRLRMKERILLAREKRMTMLYELTSALEKSRGKEAVIATAAEYVTSYFNAETIFIPAEHIRDRTSDAHGNALSALDPEVRRHVIDVYENLQPARIRTGSFPERGHLLLPVTIRCETAGVFMITVRDPGMFSFEQELFFQNIVNHISLALDREVLAELDRKNLLVAESEKLYKIIFDSISHELKTPLTTITGASTSLCDPKVDANAETRRALVLEIRDSSERLTRTVNNLLNRTRLESGMLKLRAELSSMRDLVSIVLDRLKREAEGYTVNVSIADECALITFDFNLMEQVVTNIIHNVFVHTPAGTTLTVSGEKTEGSVLIVFSDNGPGFVDPRLNAPSGVGRTGRPRTRSSGLGLGLSICRGIIEAHGGSFDALNGATGGAEIVLHLPRGENNHG